MISRKTVAILVAAGKGTRAGGDLPKQYRQLAGRSVLSHALEALARHEAIHKIIIVIGSGEETAARAAVGAIGQDKISYTIGGASRRKSVYAGLKAVDAADHVLIHDAARPFLNMPVIDRLLEGLDTHDAAIPVLPVVDTLAGGDQYLSEVVDRSGLYRIQTPQAFRYEVVRDAHARWSGPEEPTDDAQMVRALGINVKLVEGDLMLEKLTLPADFEHAERRLRGLYDARTGMGYDVHRLVAGEALWLCGVEVPHDKGLSGHSDADVALHALVDAILGALADGDIGSHFPPSDPQWRGAASSRFLEYARDLVNARGGAINHVDLTIICEAPKIGPHRDVMRARVAELLRININRVSIKATTTERLGFTGRGEGIAAQAIATLSMPEGF
ncbi:bifunctional 2-C-methyl-D-erythritol 4-phosphate cytidylyltransferase/2-C-methyl-D-erythritol 2,4-cyclodiphosphate synthase [Sphingobium sp. SCG-1]|uniref:bifunctional 2-C-methyl-D-erythritol 4-phosphate cytidylyltransferase/2-C-methyl-D-erythritol 2,4-cyclodiphosphate synthase n=1 Tax=Sphingobium sp. SCG-1 TaxID=2072936 RepID=UPI000CD69809|nr:bifunctional 2-C-methyl-D-erythritol 4-phosphate cytidylyltransferase/2-C-methyl-D-erythritol 2,4-cyclodiphosphate synthase [Sphingobium sp. SCG-1]AUW58599.1 bifunctional 2-C-methyl-D-erythritol 4-phosphate cytidylyltransferase/2-C-methyl-D-erythritol 2,4-cyclodiphosphate synthase [Sphingobium sp. SCG-1]